MVYQFIGCAAHLTTQKSFNQSYEGQRERERNGVRASERVRLMVELAKRRLLCDIRDYVSIMNSCPDSILISAFGWL